MSGGVLTIFEVAHERIMSGFLADLVVVLHAAFVVFVAVGGLLVLKAPRLAWLHLPAVAWGVGIEWTGSICPLTPIEVWLRQQAGEVGYQGDFVDQYVMSWLYPDGLTRELQIGLGGAMSTMVAWVSGERMMEVHFLPVLAFVYLMLIGTMAAYVAYGFLIRHTSPIIASSCMYVNPVVAVALGALLLGEPVTHSTVIATIVILASVGLSFWFDYRKKGLA